MPTPAKKGAHPGQLHAHGCAVCSKRYTDSCKIPDVNGRCSPCRTGRERAVWDIDMDPKPCCRDYSRPAEKEDVVKYALGGPGPWYICRTVRGSDGCSRTHPYQVRTST